MKETMCKVTLSLVLLAALTGCGLVQVEAVTKFPFKFGDLVKSVGLNKLFQSRKPDIFVKEYKIIDDHLMKHLPNNEDVTENLNVAQQWLDELTKSGKWNKKTLIKGLETFLSLRKLDGDKLCIRSSGDILEINDRSTNDSVGRLGSNTTAVEAKRIEKIIYHYARRHLDECPKKLKEKYQQINGKVPEKLKSEVDKFMESIIADHMIYDNFEWPGFDSKGDIHASIEHNPLVAAWFVVSSMKPIGSEKDMMIIYNYLDGVSERNHDIKNSALHHDDDDGDVYYQPARELFNQYLVTPCNDYHNWYDGIFEPIEFDFKYLDETEVMSKSNPVELDMMRTLALYEGCEKFLANQKKIRRNFFEYVQWVINVRGFESR